MSEFERIGIIYESVTLIVEFYQRGFNNNLAQFSGRRLEIE